ncbi:MAG: response regulator [Acidobacteria bacterium]|nr:response regulator [Acidobacteriota bacterium]
MVGIRLVLVLIPYVCLMGQAWPDIRSEIGIPFIQNFTPQVYRGSAQNWSIVQDPRGVMYFGNGDEGVLEYDGSSWRFIKIPNQSTVRALAIGDDGIIYVGAVGEFGLLEPGDKGELRYVSLVHLVPEKDRSFTDVWAVHATPQGIYFYTDTVLLRLHGSTVRTWYPCRNSFFLSFYVHQRLYVHETGAGLFVMVDDRLQPVSGSERLADDRLYMMLPLSQGRILVGTRQRGLLVYDPVAGFMPAGDILPQLSPQTNGFLRRNQIYTGRVLANGTFAIATLQAGVVILSREGEELQHISVDGGLVDDSVYSLCVDHQNGLWLGTSCGIARVELHSPLTVWNETKGLKRTVTDVLRVEDDLYICSFAGVYRLRGQNLTPVQGILEQSWSLVNFPLPGGKGTHLLLCGTNDGLFHIVDDRAERVREGRACFFMLPSRVFPGRLYLGMDDGLRVMRYDERRRTWVGEPDVPGTGFEIRSIGEDLAGHLWLGTALEGVIRVEFRAGGDPASAVATRYGTADGLAGTNYIRVAWLDDHWLFCTSGGVYRFDPSTGTFIRDPFFQQQLKEAGREISQVVRDDRGNIWLTATSNREYPIGFLQPVGDGTWQWRDAPFRRIPEMAITVVRPDRDGIVWIGGTEALFRYDRKAAGDFDQPFAALIRLVRLGEEDTLFCGTHYHTGDERFAPGRRATVQPPPGELRPTLDYVKQRSIVFEFSAPAYNRQSGNLFSVILDGYDDHWSEWSAETKKEYTNLMEGEYVFRVKARDIYGLESSEARYSFVILPPWHRTWWAYVVYSLLFCLVVYTLVNWRSRRLEKEKRILELMVEDRTFELRQKRDYLERIDTIVKTINFEVDFADLLASVLKRTFVVQGIHQASVLVYDQATDTFRFRAAFGYDVNRLAHLRLRPAELLERYIADSREVLTDIFLAKNIRARPLGKQLEHLGVPESMLVLCIRGEDRVVGYLVFENMKDEKAFDNQNIRLLEGLKEHIAAAFIKSKLLLDLQTANARLQEAMERAEQARRTAEAASKSKSEFLARMSHEIRTPMNSILGFAEMMLDTPLNEEQREYARTINQSGELLLTLINDILDFSKVEAGHLTFEMLDFDPEIIAYDVCDLMLPRLGTKSVEMICRIGDDVPGFVMGDPGRFRQVLINLMGNAVKFTDRGEIELSLETAGEEDGRIRLHVTVRDTGIGIPADKLQAIFEAFQQVDGSTTRRYGGSGLGLAICQQIARLMDGHVYAESELGRGSVFHFQARFRQSHKRRPRRIAPEILADRKVLIVDDNRNNLEVLAHVLERAGMRVTALDDGAAVVPALQKALQEGDPFAVGILDIQMPELSGDEVARRIRNLEPPLGQLPLLAFSSSTVRRVGLFEEVGFDGYLPKPIHRRKLLAMLQRILGEPRHRAPDQPRPAILTQHSLLTESGKAVSILLAEDNVMNQRLAVRMLEKAGYQLDVASNGQEAVDKYLADPDGYDLIFMDVQMPEMDGKTATQTIRRQGYHHVPIIAMTAESMKGDRERCLAAGMNDYISKPIKRAAVFQMIRKWSGASGGQGEGPENPSHQ